jgi:type VI secretion system protein ImpF
MAGAKPQDVLRHSVIDRLAERGGARGSSRDLRIGVQELRAAVRRDLEWLLNTRLVLPPEIEELERFPEARRSILGYGLPDLTTFSPANEADTRNVCALIEEAVRTFEPRLLARSVRVEFHPSSRVDDFLMHFKIHGTLYVEPIREQVSFDTNIDPSCGSLQVQEAQD